MDQLNSLHEKFNSFSSAKKVVTVAGGVAGFLVGSNNDVSVSRSGEIKDEGALERITSSILGGTIGVLSGMILDDIPSPVRIKTKIINEQAMSSYNIKMNKESYIDEYERGITRKLRKGETLKTRLQEEKVRSLESLESFSRSNSRAQSKRERILKDGKRYTSQYNQAVTKALDSGITFYSSQGFALNKESITIDIGQDKSLLNPNTVLNSTIQRYMQGNTSKKATEIREEIQRIDSSISRTLRIFDYDKNITLQLKVDKENRKKNNLEKKLRKISVPEELLEIGKYTNQAEIIIGKVRSGKIKIPEDRKKIIKGRLQLGESNRLLTLKDKIEENDKKIITSLKFLAETTPENLKNQILSVGLDDLEGQNVADKVSRVFSKISEFRKGANEEQVKSIERSIKMASSVLFKKGDNRHLFSKEIGNVSINDRYTTYEEINLFDSEDIVKTKVTRALNENYHTAKESIERTRNSVMLIVEHAKSHSSKVVLANDGVKVIGANGRTSMNFPMVSYGEDGSRAIAYKEGFAPVKMFNPLISAFANSGKINEGIISTGELSDKELLVNKGILKMGFDPIESVLFFGVNKESAKLSNLLVSRVESQIINTEADSNEFISGQTRKVSFVNERARMYSESIEYSSTVKFRKGYQSSVPLYGQSPDGRFKGISKIEEFSKSGPSELHHLYSAFEDLSSSEYHPKIGIPTGAYSLFRSDRFKGIDKSNWVAPLPNAARGGDSVLLRGGLDESQDPFARENVIKKMTIFSKETKRLLPFIFGMDDAAFDDGGDLFIKENVSPTIDSGKIRIGISESGKLSLSLPDNVANPVINMIETMSDESLDDGFKKSKIESLKKQLYDTRFENSGEMIGFSSKGQEQYIPKFYNEARITGLMFTESHGLEISYDGIYDPSKTGFAKFFGQSAKVGAIGVDKERVSLLHLSDSLFSLGLIEEYDYEGAGKVLKRIDPQNRIHTDIDRSSMSYEKLRIDMKTHGEEKEYSGKFLKLNSEIVDLAIRDYGSSHFKMDSEGNVLIEQDKLSSTLKYIQEVHSRGGIPESGVISKAAKLALNSYSNIEDVVVISSDESSGFSDLHKIATAKTKEEVLSFFSDTKNNEGVIYPEDYTNSNLELKELKNKVHLDYLYNIYTSDSKIATDIHTTLGFESEQNKEVLKGIIGRGDLYSEDAFTVNTAKEQIREMLKSRFVDSENPYDFMYSSARQDKGPEFSGAGNSSRLSWMSLQQLRYDNVPENVIQEISTPRGKDVHELEMIANQDKYASSNIEGVTSANYTKVISALIKDPDKRVLGVSRAIGSEIIDESALNFNIDIEDSSLKSLRFSTIETSISGEYSIGDKEIRSSYESSKIKLLEDYFEYKFNKGDKDSLVESIEKYKREQKRLLVEGDNSLLKMSASRDSKISINQIALTVDSENIDRAISYLESGEERKASYSFYPKSFFEEIKERYKKEGISLVLEEVKEDDSSKISTSTGVHRIMTEYGEGESKVRVPFYMFSDRAPSLGPGSVLPKQVLISENIGSSIPEKNHRQFIWIRPNKDDLISLEAVLQRGDKDRDQYQNTFVALKDQSDQIKFHQWATKHTKILEDLAKDTVNQTIKNKTKKLNTIEEVVDESRKLGIAGNEGVSSFLVKMANQATQRKTQSAFATILGYEKISDVIGMPGIEEDDLFRVRAAIHTIVENVLKTNKMSVEEATSPYSTIAKIINAEERYNLGDIDAGEYKKVSKKLYEDLLFSEEEGLKNRTSRTIDILLDSFTNRSTPVDGASKTFLGIGNKIRVQKPNEDYFESVSKNLELLFNKESGLPFFNEGNEVVVKRSERLTDTVERESIKIKEEFIRENEERFKLKINDSVTIDSSSGSGKYNIYPSISPDNTYGESPYKDKLMNTGNNSGYRVIGSGSLFEDLEVNGKALFSGHNISDPKGDLRYSAPYIGANFETSASMGSFSDELSFNFNKDLVINNESKVKDFHIPKDQIRVYAKNSSKRFVNAGEGPGERTNGYFKFNRFDSSSSPVNFPEKIGPTITTPGTGLFFDLETKKVDSFFSDGSNIATSMNKAYEEISDLRIKRSKKKKPDPEDKIIHGMKESMSNRPLGAKEASEPRIVRSSSMTGLEQYSALTGENIGEFNSPIISSEEVTTDIPKGISLKEKVETPVINYGRIDDGRLSGIIENKQEVPTSQIGNLEIDESKYRKEESRHIKSENIRPENVTEERSNIKSITNDIMELYQKGNNKYKALGLAIGLPVTAGVVSRMLTQDTGGYADLPISDGSKYSEVEVRKSENVYLDKKEKTHNVPQNVKIIIPNQNAGISSLNNIIYGDTPRNNRVVEHRP